MGNTPLVTHFDASPPVASFHAYSTAEAVRLAKVHIMASDLDSFANYLRGLAKHGTGLIDAGELYSTFLNYVGEHILTGE